MRNFLKVSSVALATLGILASTVSTANAQEYYRRPPPMYYRNNGSVVGALVGGMVLGAVIASQRQQAYSQPASPAYYVVQRNGAQVFVCDYIGNDFYGRRHYGNCHWRYVPQNVPSPPPEQPEP